MRYAFLLFLSAQVFASHRHSLYDLGLAEIKACHHILFKLVTFCPEKPKTDYECYCYNIDALASLVGCVKYIEPKLVRFKRSLIKHCDARGFTMTNLNIQDSLEYLDSHGRNVTPMQTSNATMSVKSYPLLKIGDIESSHITGGVTTKRFTISDFPVFVNESSVNLHYGVFSRIHENFNWSLLFSDLLYAYWGLVFFFAALFNWGRRMLPRLGITFHGRLSKVWRKYVTSPALVGRKRASHQVCFTLFDFLVPTRLESLVLFVYLALILLFNALFIDADVRKSFQPTDPGLILKIVADRTGIIGTMLLPLLIIIGGRNNILQWLTKWKFSTFLIFHRWIGRTIVSLIVIHSLAYGAIFIRENSLAVTMKREPAIYGTLATSAGIIIFIQGVLFLRRRFYELFFVSHIALGLVFMWGSWVHLKSRMFKEWVFVACSVWALDMAIRVTRILSFGAPKATLKLLPGDCIRVTVPKPRYWKSVPGGHAWVYFWHSWSFWQSHPFTFLDSVEEKDHIVFLIKAKRGATRRIADYLKCCPEMKTTIRVCIEGPYGGSCLVERHDNVVFLAGGNGIPGMLSESVALAKCSEGPKKTIKLIWVVRDYQTVGWIWQELQVLKGTNIEVTIYITSPECINKQDSEESSVTNSTIQDHKGNQYEGVKLGSQSPHKCLNHVVFLHGRPSMDEVVERETECAIKGVAFITCGHPVMVDDLRYAVVQKIDQTEKRVDFYEQLQVWA